MNRTRAYRSAGLIGIPSLGLTIIGGCPGAALVGFTIAASTFAFLLEATGVIDVLANAPPVRSAGVVTLPFTGVPQDRPASATLNLNVGRTRALPVSAKPQRQQSLTGNATVRVRIADGGSTNPCDEGVEVGTFLLSISNGVVSSSNPALPLPPAALEHAISGEFALCLEVTATVNVRLVIEEMSITFGPADGGGNINDNSAGGNDNGGSNDNVANANDNVDGNANDNIGGNENSNTDENTSAGFTLANVLHVGSEAILAGPNAHASTGFVLPDKFNVGRIGLSGDGTRIWFYIWWDSIQTAPSDWIRVYSVNVDGSDLKRNDLSGGATVLGGGFLTVNLDGTTAIWEMVASRGTSFSNTRTVSQFFRCSPGQTATLVFEADKYLHPQSAGPGNGRGLRITDDGSAFFWNDGNSFWRLGTAGGTPQQLVTVEHLNFYGPWDPFTGGTIKTFDITGDGGRWLLHVTFAHPDTPNILRHELVTAAGALPQNMTGLAKPTPNDKAINDVQWSDDGSVIAYSESNAFGMGDGWLLYSDHNTNINTAAEPRTYGVSTLILSDDGNVAHSVHRPNPEIYTGGGPIAYLDVPSTTRRSVGTTKYQHTYGGVYDRQLSDNGQVMAGLWNARGIGTALNNVFVLREGVEGLPGHPAIGNIYYRYDPATDMLAVRAHVTSPNGLERIYLLPYKDGVEIGGYVVYTEYALRAISGGGGVNLSTVLSPVASLADTYELAFTMYGKHALLDASHTIRVVAVDSTGTRVTFRDFSPYP